MPLGLRRGRRTRLKSTVALSRKRWCCRRQGCSQTSSSKHPPRRRSSKDRCVSDRKSTRLNSSHANNSYAVFCLKKKREPPAEYPTPLRHDDLLDRWHGRVTV